MWIKSLDICPQTALFGLQTIPKDLYEAFRLEGGSSISALLNITIPLLKPYILIFLFSCELDQQFGVQEFEDSFSYYDFIAYGWGEVFNGDKTLALDYFNQALNSSDMTYYNCAIVGMGWAVTYQANNLLNTLECIDNPRGVAYMLLTSENKSMLDKKILHFTISSSVQLHSNNIFFNVSSAIITKYEIFNFS